MTEGWPPEPPTIPERRLSETLAQLERRAVAHEGGAYQAGMLDVIDTLRDEYGLPDQ